MDEVDRANQLVEEFTQHSINSIRERQFSVKDSADHCEECGCQISSARQIAVPGCTMCTECATAFEQREAHYSH